jgi:hypothetical protein
VLTLAPGDHGTQRILENATLSACSENVVFQGQANVSMAEVQFGHCQGCFATNAADHVTVKGPLKLQGGVSCIGDCQNIVIDGVDGGAVLLDSLGNAGGPFNWLIKNSDWGPCQSSGSPDCHLFYDKGAKQIEIGAGCCPGSSGTSLSDISFVGNTIHDFKIIPPDHYECVRTSGGRNYAFRANKFWGCEIYALATTNWGGTNYVENNWFGGADDIFGGGRALAGTIAAGATLYARFNSFSARDGITTDTNESGAGWQIIGNILGHGAVGDQCLPQAVYKYNVYSGAKCGDATNTGGQTLLYVNPARGPNMDYHLAGGPWLADNYVPSSQPGSDLATDFDGQPRSVPREAGSDGR